MKIAIFVETFPHSLETFILNQIIYLVNQGHTIHIYAFGKDNQPVSPRIEALNLLSMTTYISQQDKTVDIKATVYGLLGLRRNFFSRSSLNLFKYKRDAIVVKKHLIQNVFNNALEYDIIHAHFGIMGKVATLFKEWGIMKQVPLVTSFHGYDINPKNVKNHAKEYKELFKISSIITANSTFTLNLLKEANCPLSKLFKLPESLDTSFFQKNTHLVKDNNFIHIVFCGRFVEFKAPELVPEIANILINERGHKNLKFHIIGGGILEAMVTNAIDRYNLSDYIIMYGLKPQHTIIDIMSVMDIFLYPGINDKITGRAENQGLILQEAQALELPIITSNVGGIIEGIVDKVTAFIVAERDVVGFADKVELLANDKNMRLEMGKCGRDYVIKNFDYNIVGRRLEELYDACVLK